ncbi:MAG: hypothetical protein U0103_08365 [Candidatus Obscuribacterales bacterium]|jgi:hypothetical protein
MLEEIWGAATGKWGLLAVVLLASPAARKGLRSVAKEAVKAGLVVTDGVKDLVAEIKDEANDVVAEAKAERKNSDHKHEKQHAGKAHE